MRGSKHQRERRVRIGRRCRPPGCKTFLISVADPGLDPTTLMLLLRTRSLGLSHAGGRIGAWTRGRAAEPRFQTTRSDVNERTRERLGDMALE